MSYDPRSMLPANLGRLLGYDAVASRGRRRSVAPLMRSEDRELNSGQRAKLVASTRDIGRNFSMAAWAVRKHLDYVSSFTFQATTGIDEVDDQLERLIKWRSRAVNCDAARRHSLPRLMRLWEARRTIDGDTLISRLRTGRLQTFEADRVRDPVGAPAGQLIDMTNVVQGVEIDPVTGETLKYHISDRQPRSDLMTYRGALAARYCNLLAYYDRIDQVRGVSPMAPAVNTFRDVYENFDYAMAKAKVAQLFALAFYREDADGGGGGLPRPGGEAGEEDPDGPKYPISFDGGPINLDLAPGDRAEVLESRTPSGEFQSFTTTMLGVALKCLDIPLSFYDESRANFSSGRQAWILYEQSATSKRADLRDVLDDSTAFWTASWVLDGSLVLPRGMLPRDVSWQWIHTGIPWMDPLKEITADIASVKAGMGSRTRLLRERGLNYYDVIDELAAEKAYADEKGVSLGDEAMDLAAMARTSMAENTKDATDP